MYVSKTISQEDSEELRKEIEKIKSKPTESLQPIPPITEGSLKILVKPEASPIYSNILSFSNFTDF